MIRTASPNAATPDGRTRRGQFRVPIVTVLMPGVLG